MEEDASIYFAFDFIDNFQACPLRGAIPPSSFCCCCCFVMLPFFAGHVKVNVKILIRKSLVPLFLVIQHQFITVLTNRILKLKILHDQRRIIHLPNVEVLFPPAVVIMLSDLSKPKAMCRECFQRCSSVTFIFSGHEAAFAAFLCCLCKVGALRVDDQLAIVLKVFNR